MTSIPESHRDLLSEQVLTLATIGSSGRPQLSNVWFVAEGDTIKMSLNTARQKVKNLQANPACSVIITGNPPYKYLEVRGDKVGAKYNADLRERDNPGDKRVVVSVRPARIVVWG
jgi:general stress protein 26